MISARPTRRPWFRFSLRTMFVVVTVFAVWLGWRPHDMRARQAAYHQIMSNRGSFACWRTRETCGVWTSDICATFTFGQAALHTQCRSTFRMMCSTPEELAWASAFPEADILTPSTPRSGSVRLDTEPGSHESRGSPQIYPLTVRIPSGG